MYFYTVLIINVVTFVFANEHRLMNISPYETPNAIREQGYVSETHRVVTDDGYIVEMHRIPFRRNETTGAANRPVVFLMHGLTAASNSYIMLGPEYAIAYNLADAGFDVWMGNARGTKNSRHHTTWDPDGVDRHAFFDFTWEQIGYYDVANMVEYILKMTGNEGLHYIGHSQGGTNFLVLNSMRPEFNGKFISAHLLAGVGYKNYFPNRPLTALAMFTNTIYRFAVSLGIVEMFPPRNRGNDTRLYNDGTSENSPDNYKEIHTGDGENFDFDCDKDSACHPADYCTGDVSQKYMCTLFGVEHFVSPRILDLIPELSIGGAAFKQVAHYGQNIQDRVFRRWNYGQVANFLAYGTQDPPIYDISLITVNMTMHYTVADVLLDERDVVAMCEVIPNCKKRKVERETFKHEDFVAAADVKELVTEYIIEQIFNDQASFEAIAPAPELSTPSPLPDGSSSLAPTSIIIYIAFYLIHSLYR